MATINNQKSAEDKEKIIQEEKKPKKVVVVKELPSGGVMVASGDCFRSKLFIPTELEEAVKCRVALSKKPIRPVERELSRPTWPQY